MRFDLRGVIEVTDEVIEELCVVFCIVFTSVVTLCIVSLLAPFGLETFFPALLSSTVPAAFLFKPFPTGFDKTPAAVVVLLLSSSSDEESKSQNDRLTDLSFIDCDIPALATCERDFFTVVVVAEFLRPYVMTRPFCCRLWNDMFDRPTQGGGVAI